MFYRKLKEENKRLKKVETDIKMYHLKLITRYGGLKSHKTSHASSMRTAIRKIDFIIKGKNNDNR